MSEEKNDKLEDVFNRQAELMDLLIMGDKLPEAPVDITSKPGQRLIKELGLPIMSQRAAVQFEW